MEKKKGLTAPHTFVLLVGLLIITALLTYIIPAGSFERIKDPATGKTLVQAGSYALVKAHPVSLLQIPVVIYKAIVKSAGIIAFILIIGGAFEIITETGVLTAISQRLAALFKNNKYLVVPTFITLFSVFGTTMGMSSEVMIFVPLGIALASSLGLDRVTGTAMVVLGAAVGFTAGVLNPFSVGIAQGIAQVPLFSGMGYRLFILVVLIVVTSLYVIAYAKRVLADPTKSIIYGQDEGNEFETHTMEEVPLKGKKLLILLEIVVGMVVLIYGLVYLDWFYEEMSALFLTMGIVAGLTEGFSPNKVASIFGRGCAGICVGALVIGFARGIEVIMSDAKILDTIVYHLSLLVQGLPVMFQAVGMFIVQSIISCIITSGSGQAVVTMPLMTPLADIVGISRQTAVLAYQLGDGFSNSILPTSSSLMGYLYVSKIPYTSWMRFIMPLFTIWTILGCVFMIVAIVIGY